MAITLGMILARFFCERPEACAKFEGGSAPIAGVRLLPEGAAGVQAGFLYVARANSAEAIERAAADARVLLIAREDAPPPEPRGAIAIRAKLSFAECFNLLQQICDDFAEWGRRLEFAVLRGASFEEAISIAGEMLPAPVLLYDPALKVLASSAACESFNDPIFQSAVKNGYMDVESVKHFERRRSFDAVSASGFFEGAPDSYCRHADFVQAISIEGEVAAYCVLLYCPLLHAAPLSRGYMHELFGILCGALCRLVQRLRSALARSRSLADIFLIDLLDNPATPSEAIKERLCFNDLGYEGVFCALSVHASGMARGARDYFIQHLRRKMLNARAFLYKESAVILYIFGGSPAVPYRECLEAQLEPLLRDFSANCASAGASRLFYCIADFADAYTQAEHAWQLASPYAAPQGSAPSGPDGRRVFFFEDCPLADLLFQSPVKNKAFFYCEPCILDLLQKNTKKSLKRLRILYEYLSSCCSCTAVAEKMGMHRNNVIYHIKSLDEEYGLRLDCPSARLKLLISFEVIKGEFRA